MTARVALADLVATMVNATSRARRCPACHTPLICFEGRMSCPNRLLLLAQLAGGAG